MKFFKKLFGIKDEDEAVALWLRENPFSVVAAMIKREMGNCHLSYNPGRKPKSTVPSEEGY